MTAGNFIRHYDLHGILKFQVRYEAQNIILPGYNFPYSYFEVEHVDNPSIILNIAPFEPDNDGCDIVFGKYHVKEGYVYCHDQEGLSSWHVEFHGIGTEKTVINFCWNRLPPRALIAPSYFPQAIYIEPLLDFKLAEKGYCLLHSAAVAHNKKAILFAGRSGASKSPIIAYYLKERGYSFMGDDKVIIKEGNVYSFPRSIKLFNYSFKHDYTKELGGLLEKVKAVYYMRQTEDKNGYEFGLEDKASIYSINILSKSQETELPLIHPKKREEIVSSLVNSNLGELVCDLLNTNKLSIDSYFLNCMLAYSYIFPDSLYSTYSALIRKNIDNALYNNLRMSEIVLGTSYTKSQFDDQVGEFLRTKLLV